MNPIPDPEMTSAFAPLRQVTAGPDLQERVARSAKEMAGKRRRRWLTVLVGIGALIGFLRITPAPAPLTATGLVSQMRQAVESARSIHARFYIPAGDAWKIEREIWLDGRKYRFDSSKPELIMNESTRWDFFPEQGLALESVRPGNDEESLKNARTQLGLTFEFHPNPPKTRVVSDGVVRRSGRSLEHWRLVQKDPVAREVSVWVDLSTHQPVEGELKVPTPSGWKVRFRWDCTYDQPISSSVFSPAFGPGIRVVKRSDLAQQLLAQLATPIATTKLGTATVAIRSAQVNPKGWVFLLWTGNIGGANFRLFLKDSRGREYARASFNPGVESNNPSLDETVRLGSQVVDGAWFVPVEPIEPGLGLSYHLRIVSSRWPSGGSKTQAQITMRRVYEPIAKPVPSAKVGDPIQKEVAGISIRQVTPLTASLPPYVILFESGPRSERIANLAALNAQKQYWNLRLSHERIVDHDSRVLVPRMALDGEPVYSSVLLSESGKPLAGALNRDVLRRLEQIQLEILGLTDKPKPMGVGECIALMDLATIQEALGEVKSAKETRERVKEFSPY